MKKCFICLIGFVLLFVELSFGSFATEAQAADEEYDLTTCSGVHFYLTVHRPAENFSATTEDGAEVHYHGTRSSSITIGSIFIGEAQYEFSINEVGVHKLLFRTEGGFSNTYLVNVTEHQWDEGVIYSAATCTEAGSITYTCTICNTTKTESIKALGHAYGKWTRLDDDQHQRVCANDASHVKTENHKWNDGVVTVAARCDQDGIKEHICEVCGAKKTETIAALGHTYGEWTKIDDEQHQRICQKDTSHVEIEKHSWNDGEIITVATCIKEGEKLLTCLYCGATKTVSTIGDHAWDSGVVTTEATCTSSGTKTFTCTVCGEKKYEAIDMIEHKLVKTEAKAATCITDGNVEYYTCSECDGVFADSEGSEEIKDVIIPKIGGTHTWDNGVITIKPTCTSTGVRTFTCMLCGDNKEEVIDKIEHKLVRRGGQSPTCTTEGHVEYYICSECNKTFTDAKGLNEIDNVTVKALGHNFVRVKVARKPTTNKEGIELWKCLNCGKNETRTIPKLESEVASGDVNGDGDVLANDARLALRASAKLETLTETQKKAADVDGSGDVLANDARQILRFSAKLQKEFLKKTA